jgi:hypothetical protein
MGDGIGHTDMLVAKRESMVARLSPGARHAAFPKLYARPIPREATVLSDATAPLKEEIARLRAQNADLERENARLHRTVEEFFQPKVKPVKIEAVLVAFVAAMVAAGRTINDKPYSSAHLFSIRRDRLYSDPRLVCMWLCRVLTRDSFPNIAKAIGNRDHTTALHAFRRGPEIVDADPVLRDVAASVQLSLGASA